MLYAVKLVSSPTEPAIFCSSDGDSTMLSQLVLALAVSFAAALDIQSKGGGTALIINDVQECFLQGGTLPVTGGPGGMSVQQQIQQIYDEKSCLFDLVVQSQDFHPAGHISFATSHGFPDGFVDDGELPITCIKPEDGNIEEASCCPSFHLNTANDCGNVLCPGNDANFVYDASNSIVAGNMACTTCAAGASPQSCFTTTQRMWPVHCLSTQDGDSALQLDIDESEYELIQKGDNKFVDAYSAFADNTNNLQTRLQDLLQENDIEHVYIVGLATDVVVNYTVRDAVDRGYRVTVVGDATAGISDDSYTEALEEFEELGVEVVSTEDVLGMSCKGYGRRKRRGIHPAVRKVLRKIRRHARKHIRKHLRRHYSQVATLQKSEVDTSSGARRPELETDAVHFMQEGIRHQEL